MGDQPAWMEAPLVDKAPPQGAQPAWMAAPIIGASVNAGSSALPAKPQAPPDNAAVSALKGAAGGFGKLALGGQELLGRGVSAFAPQAGRAIEADAQKGLDRINTELGPDLAAHPWATFLGDLAGSSVTPVGAAGKIAKAYNIASPMVEAAVAGITNGLLTPVHRAQMRDLDRSLGAFASEKLKQIGIGAAGGAAAGVVGKVLQDPAKKMLVAAGVKLTPGQIAGAAANHAEQKATAVPVVGHFIAEARKEAMHSFNTAAINQALKPIGASLPADVKAGHAAISAAADALDDAYDKVLPNLSLRVDSVLDRDLSDVMRRIQGGTLPHAQVGQFNKLIANFLVPRFTANKYMTGNTFKAVESELSQLAKTYRGSSLASEREFGSAIQDVRDVLRANVTRQNPKFAGELQKVNQAYALYKPIQRAAADSATTEGVFSPAKLLQKIKQNDPTKDKLNTSEGVAAMQPFAQAAQKVVGNTVPDSGTAGRLLQAHLVNHILGGGVAAGGAAATGTGAPMAAAAALGSALYTKPGTAAFRAAAQAMPQTRRLVARSIAGGLPLPQGAQPAQDGAQ